MTSFTTSVCEGRGRIVHLLVFHVVRVGLLICVDPLDILLLKKIWIVSGLKYTVSWSDFRFLQSWNLFVTFGNRRPPSVRSRPSFLL